MLLVLFAIILSLFFIRYKTWIEW